MPNQIDRTLLNDVAISVLEQTAFIFCEAANLQDGIDLDAFEFIKVRIEFSGDQDGLVIAIAPGKFCCELAENMLGEELITEECGEKNIDALKEILNIIAGQYLIRLYGDRAVFDLSAPEATEISSEELCNMVGQYDFGCCLSDDYPILTLALAAKEVI